MKIVLDEEFKQVLSCFNGCKHDVLNSFFNEVVRFKYDKKTAGKNKKRYIKQVDESRIEGLSFEKIADGLVVSTGHYGPALRFVSDKVFKCETQGKIWEGTFTTNAGGEKTVYKVEINKDKNIVKCSQQKEKTRG